MDKEFENIIKQIKNIKLSTEEKSLMRTHILENLIPEEKIKSEYVTIPDRNRLYYYYQNIRDNYFMMNKNKFVGAFAVIAIVFITGGTSAFAEKSIPGDFLYRLKISVNEPVASVFAITKEEKTEWKERLVERRLKEAHTLASIGKLDEVKRFGLEEKIKTQVDDFNASVNELALEDNQSAKSSELNIRLQASIKAYQNVLGALMENSGIDSNTKIETEKLIATLENSKNKTKDDNKNIELGLGVASSNDTTVVSTSDQVSTKQTAALNLLNSTKLSYQKEKLNLSTNIQSKIDIKFASAENSQKDGDAAFVAKDYPKALEKFQEVISGVNSIKLLMLSNVIKGDIEDDEGIENYRDIEDDENFEIEDHIGNKIELDD